MKKSKRINMLDKKMKSNFCPQKRLASAIAFSLSLVVLPAAAQTAGLVDVYKMARDYDPRLAQAKAQYQADQQQLIALEGGLRPQIQADLNYANQSSIRNASDIDTTDLSLTLNQSLYQHELWARIDQSELALTTSELALKTAEQDLILNVTEAYFAVLLAQQTLKLFQSREESDRLQLESATASAEVGLASQVDVLQAKSNYDISKSNRINAENSLDIAQEELQKITGQALDQLKTLPIQTEFAPLQLNLSDIEKTAQMQNLAVQTANTQAQIAKQEIEVQKSGYWPTVSLQARINDTSYDRVGSSSSLQDNTRNTISFNVSVPIYSGGSTDANITAARFQSQKSLEALRDSKNQARVNARTQARNIQRGEVLIAALREAVKSNDAFLAAAEEGFKVGLKDLLEVFSARSNQVNARKNLIEALHNQVLNQLRLEATLGDLSEQDLQQFDQLLRTLAE
ncbi:outer membrane channel protein [Thiosulfatimonas sediminis]|uniref:Outer membrane channel protein n=1 Tax=Thiosulfatimonas sediminis TaxID=2675054 RepID=A0A6F8PV29_9GAMM|nr:TolC family outer membrane protein [Thiosulfatimonas sediminis]BBP45830.1 outer membrane channel protein [Thiosulfatimonas sediminis]